MACPALIAAVGCKSPEAAAPPAQPATAAPTAAATLRGAGGMWMPSQLPEHAARLQQMGLELDPSKLADPMGYPLGAVVSLGGCSGSFVSPEGLVATNHHCVTGALQFVSTPKENLLENGFVAAERRQEKPIGPTGRVYVTRAFTDVTAEVRANLEQISGDLERHRTVEARIKAIVERCENDRPYLRCDVAPYFGGATYLAIERLEIRDVRLAYAPAEGVGNFGGDIDNWRWPRHSGDFALYRAYVGKDGQPADHARDNVPYRPTVHLRMPDRPLAPGDLVFVAGYPGRTYRLHTAAEVQEAVEWYYPYRIDMCTEYLAEIAALGQNDPELALKATPLERGLSNALKYSQGALEGLTKGGAAQEKQRLEAELARFIAQSPETKARFGGVLEQLATLLAHHRQTRAFEAAVGEVVRLPALAGAAVNIVDLAVERPKPDAERDPEYQERNWKRLEQRLTELTQRSSRKLDQGLLTLATLRAARLPDAKQRQSLVFAITGLTDPDEQQIRTAVAAMFAKTRLVQPEVPVRLLKTGKLADLAKLGDPMIDMALRLHPIREQLRQAEQTLSGALLLLRPRYIAALQQFVAAPIAPDANGTLRVTFGNVKGYRPRPDATEYEPFTVAPEVVTKHTGKQPFDAPLRLVQAIQTRNFGAYRDPRLGDLPVNFLADTDITGGNSGSPTLDARGRLVGLAFDGNYEAMASDWLFMPEITRSIHVDIRYMLWMMDAVDGADALLAELGVTPTIGP